MILRSLALVAGLLVAVSIPATASATPVVPRGYDAVANWSSRAGTTHCLMLQHRRGGNAVMCTTNVYTASPRTVWTFLSENGRARSFRAFPFQGETEAKIPYGRTWYLSGGIPKLRGSKRTLRCSVHRTKGTTCRNARSGFRIRLVGGREVRSRW